MKIMPTERFTITIFRYSIQIILLTLFTPGIQNVEYTIIGALFSYLIYPAKSKLFISNIVFAVSLKFPSIFFFTYGFVIASTYTSIERLVFALEEKAMAMAFILEISGLVLSQFIEIPIIIGYLLFILQIVNIVTLVSPPFEEDDDMVLVLSKIRNVVGTDNHTILSEEYKAALMGRKKYKWYEFCPDFLTPCMLIHKNNVFNIIYWLSLMSQAPKSYFIIFIFAFLYILGYKILSTIVSFFSKFYIINRSPVVRCISLTLFYYAIKGV